MIRTDWRLVWFAATVFFGNTTVLAVVAIAQFRAALTPLIGRTNLPFTLFFFAAAFAAWFGGFRPAVVASVPAPENMTITPKGEPVSMLLMNGTADPMGHWDGGDIAFYGVLSNRGRTYRTDGDRDLACKSDVCTDLQVTLKRGNVLIFSAAC